MASGSSSSSSINVVASVSGSSSSSIASSIVPSLGNKPNQPTSFSFPKRSFGKKDPVFRSFQSSWFKKWPWLHYDQAKDLAFCFTCIKASKLGNQRVCASRGEETFVSHGFSNWKDACGEKSGGFIVHERSHYHKYSVELLKKGDKRPDITEMLSSSLEKERRERRAYLRKVLQNIIFLGRQGLAMRGAWVCDDNEEGTGSEFNSNFHQLMLLRGNDDPKLLELMQQKKHKYTDHHIQNEFLKFVALDHLRKIASNIQQLGYYTLQADEVTDASNKEQVVTCLRWVDSQFEPH